MLFDLLLCTSAVAPTSGANFAFRAESAADRPRRARAPSDRGQCGKTRAPRRTRGWPAEFGLLLTGQLRDAGPNHFRLLHSCDKLSIHTDPAPLQKTPNDQKRLRRAPPVCPLAVQLEGLHNTHTIKLAVHVTREEGQGANKEATLPSLPSRPPKGQRPVQTSRRLRART